MSESKPIQGANKDRTLGAKLRDKDWVKKLEAASGEQIKPSSLPRSTSGSMEEQRRVQFRCAKTGRPFFVLLARQVPSRCFRVVLVSKEESVPFSDHHENRHLKTNITEKSFDASDFDWTDWYCPHCSYSDTFVNCNECNELVCGGRIRKLEDGTQFFTCHDDCGSTGKIEGFIELYKGSQEQMPKGHSPVLPRHSSEGKSLPPTRKQLPPSEN